MFDSPFDTFSIIIFCSNHEKSQSNFGLFVRYQKEKGVEDSVESHLSDTLFLSRKNTVVTFV